jgi:hypothetical protein
MRDESVKFHRAAGTFLEPKGGLGVWISCTDDVRLGIMLGGMRNGVSGHVLNSPCPPCPSALPYLS